MTDARLTRVHLDRFRGATTPVDVAFDAVAPVVLLFGENGAGKSSVVDAIDAVANSHAGSVRDRSSTRVSQHLPALGARPADVRVSIATAQTQWDARLSGDTLTTHPPYDGAPIHVLRRATLLTLVNAEPSARFAVLERFVDVANVEAGEDALATAARDAANGVKRLDDAIARAAQQLEELWIAASRPDRTATQWAELLLGAQRASLPTDHERAQRVLAAAETFIADRDALAEQSTRADAAAAAVDAARTTLSSLGGDDSLRAAAALLRDARALLDAEPAGDTCPVCEQPADALRDRLDARLARAGALVAAMAALDRAERDARVTTALTDEAARRYTTSAATLAASVTVERLTSPLREIVARVRDLSPSDDARAAADDLAAHVDALRALAAAHAEKLRRQMAQSEAVRVVYDQLVAREDERHDAARLQARLDAALAVVRCERTAFLQEQLDAVRDACNRLYEAVHPAEGVRLNRLRLDAKRRKSLHQDVEFGERSDVPPQAYLSESHLDTFGLCFWLAATMQAPSDVPPIVVLDDALASIDAPHAARLLVLLAALAQDGALTQVIVATHDRGWLDAIESSAALTRAARVVTFGSWTLGGGIRPSA